MTSPASSTTGPSPNRLFAYAVLVLTPLFFSSNLVFGRATISEVAPFTLAFLRWGFCAVILLPFVLRVRAEAMSLVLQVPLLILVLGILGMGVSGAGPYYGLQYTTATNATLIYTTSPIMIILLERIFLGRPIRWREAIGVAIAFIGVAVILFKGSVENLLAASINFGDLLVLFASLSWAGYSILFRDSRLSVLPIMALFGLVCFAGALVLAPFALFEFWSGARMPTTIPAWQGIAGIVVFSSLLAFSGFQSGLRTFGASITGISLYLLPVYGVVLAVLLLNERLEAHHVAGIVLVLAGVVLATYPARKKIENPA